MLFQKLVMLKERYKTGGRQLVEIGEEKDGLGLLQKVSRYYMSS